MNPALHSLYPYCLRLPCQLAFSLAKDLRAPVPAGGWGDAERVDRTKLGLPCCFKPLAELCYPPPCLEGAVHLRGSEEHCSSAPPCRMMGQNYSVPVGSPQAGSLQAYILSTFRCHCPNLFTVRGKVHLLPMP